MKDKKSAAKTAVMKKGVSKVKAGTLSKPGKTAVKRSGKGKMC